MDLFDRMYSRVRQSTSVRGSDRAKFRQIPVHTLPSFLADYSLGGMNRRSIFRHFNMLGRDRIQTGRLMDKADAASDPMAYLAGVEFIMRIEEVSERPNRKRFVKRLGI